MKKRSEQKTLNDYSNRVNKQLHTLFSQALATMQALEFAYCLLRVGGTEDKDWDELIESRRTMMYLQDLLKVGKQQLSKKKQLVVTDRINLFIYCHLIEMKAPYHIIANLLKLHKKECYTVDPFNLAEKRRKRKTLLGSQPVIYPNQKLRIIKTLDLESIISPSMYDFYDDRVRNAFYHSDFVITGSQFRIPSQIADSIIPLDQVRLQIQKAFIFYSYFFGYVENYKKLYTSLDGREFDLFKLYGEKLKFIINKGSLVGFEVSRPNNTNSKYVRTNKGVRSLNMSFTKNGEIGFFVGDLDFLRKWYVEQTNN